MITRIILIALAMSVLPGCIVYNLWKANEQTKPRFDKRK